MLVMSTVSLNAQPITAGEHTRVQTVYGPIEGYQDGNIFTFKGIPYAHDDIYGIIEYHCRITQHKGHKQKTDTQ